MIDIHNFARYNNQIIGQGGPSNSDFASFWGALAGKYADEERIMFGLMNEPHHLDINDWADTCQEAVNAIRKAGATSQMILLPGTNFDSAATLLETGSVDTLMDIRNPDGSVDGLVLDVHKYLDEDNSGTHEECVTDNVDSFRELAEHLRDIGRLAMVSETGASRSSSVGLLEKSNRRGSLLTSYQCLEKFCAQNEFINENSDVFLGIVGWAAGSFSNGYLMSLTPEMQNGRYVDNQLMKECVVAPWVSSKETLPPVRPNGSSSGASRTSPTSSTSSDSTGPSKGSATNGGRGGNGGGSNNDANDDSQGGMGSVMSSPALLALFISASVATIFL